MKKSAEMSSQLRQAPEKDEVAEKKVGSSKNLPVLDYDPVQRGLTLTVDTSPRHRNISLVKAKLREQETKHALEIVKLKEEHEERETLLRDAREEVIRLREYGKELEGKVEKLEKENKKLVIGDERATKDLVILTNKCAELQGRLDESRAARDTSRLHFENVEKEHEEKIEKIKREMGEKEEMYREAAEGLERQIKDLELQVKETRESFKKCMSEQVERLRMKEEEVEKVREEGRVKEEKMLNEQNKLRNQIGELQEELKIVESHRDELQEQLEKNQELHEAAEKKLREEGEVRELEWNEEMVRQQGVLEDLRVQLENVNREREKIEQDLESCRKKHEESINTLKETLMVIDEQNKELTLEVERIREQFEENLAYRNELASKVDALLEQLNQAQSDKEDLLKAKLNLEAELDERGGELNEMTVKIQELKAACDIQLKQLQVKIDTHDEALNAKDSEINYLSKKLEQLRLEHAATLHENTELGVNLASAEAKLETLSANYESGKQQVTKMNLEVLRLVDTIVDLKNENIDLKMKLDCVAQEAKLKVKLDSMMLQQAKKKSTGNDGGGAAGDEDDNFDEPSSNSAD